MKIYSNLNYISQYKIPGYEFEVLNELKDLSNRSDENCLYHTRFLFEMDYLPLKDQCELAQKIKSKLVRIVFSGSKSLHCIVEFDKQYEDECRTYYKQIWKVINDKLFSGNCDSQCTNPSRLTRTPNVVRKNTQLEQKLIYCQPSNWFPDAAETIKDARYIATLDNVKNACMASLNASKHQLDSNTIDTSRFKNVKRYLDTPFPKQSGNGNSNLWLYSALQTTKKYNDFKTQQMVIDKAKSEGWTDKEIEHKLK